ncbi:MAG: HlyD family type I secretion periplasmic adaptor subunit [Pseudomonadota bacterium]
MFGPPIEEDFINDPVGVRTGGLGLFWVVAVILGGLAGFGLWASQYEIEEVTRGTGRVVPSSELQVIQSLEGGIVAGLDVRSGDVVEAGDVLMRIDDVGADARRGELLEREAALLAEQARVVAEAERADALTFPAGLEARVPGPVAAERAVFLSRRSQLSAELAILEDQLAGRMAAREELAATEAKLEGQLVPLREELELSERLAETGALPRIELLRLRGRVSEIDGEAQVMAARLPAQDAAIRETESRIAAAQSAYSLEAQERAARIQVELAVVREELRAAEDRVTRTSLRAPVAGTVNRVNVTTVGAVVQPGAPVMEIVPSDDRLLIEAEIRPEDVSFLRPGDPASVKITAYDFLVYGSLAGEVLRVGADTVTDRDGRAFFQVEIETERTALTGPGGEALPISPGMVAQVDIQTGSRTVMSYLLRPIDRARAEALRER